MMTMAGVPFRATGDCFHSVEMGIPIAQYIKASRQLVVNGRRTTIILEKVFWDHLDALATRLGVETRIVVGRLEHQLQQFVDGADEPDANGLKFRQGINLTSALRVWVTALAAAPPGQAAGRDIPLPTAGS